MPGLKTTPAEPGLTGPGLTVKGTPFGENGWIEIGSGASATLHDASAKDGNDSKWTPRRDT